LEQPNGMTDSIHKPTLLCLYEALREADGAPRIHSETNWVGPFCRWVSKVKIWFADGFSVSQSLASRLRELAREIG
jgi:hypothetical protein